MNKYAIGIDIGGTKIAAGVVDRGGRLLARYYSRAHTGHPPELVVDGVREAFAAVLAEAGIERSAIRGVGVGCAGHINHRTGEVVACSNLPCWDHVPLRQWVAECVDLPVYLDNDANCAALGEYLHGAGRGARDMCYVTFSTGYGAGLILDGRLYRGALGMAGEIGHAIVVPDGAPCTCGKRGCVMPYASGLALSRAACERVRAGAPTVLRETCGDAPESISGEAIAAAALLGDALARELIATALRYLGISLANIVEILNPEVIVIGGGLGRIAPSLLAPCFDALDANLQPFMRGATRVVPSELWDDAGLIGAAALVWESSAAC
jgi:glucokinase